MPEISENAGKNREVISLLPQTSFLVFGLRRGKDLEFCLLNCNNLVGDKKYLLRLRLTAPNGIVLLSKQSLYIKYILFITCHLIDSQCVHTNTSYLMKKKTLTQYIWRLLETSILGLCLFQRIFGVVTKRYIYVREPPHNLVTPT